MTNLQRGISPIITDCSADLDIGVFIQIFRNNPFGDGFGGTAPMEEAHRIFVNQNGLVKKTMSRMKKTMSRMVWCTVSVSRMVWCTLCWLEETISIRPGTPLWRPARAIVQCTIFACINKPKAYLSQRVACVLACYGSSREPTWFFAIVQTVLTLGNRRRLGRSLMSATWSVERVPCLGRSLISATWSVERVPWRVAAVVKMACNKQKVYKKGLLRQSSQSQSQSARTSIGTQTTK